MTATAETRRMTAWRQSGYGAPDVVHAERVDVPTPGPDEVLLRVRATSLNAADHHVMRGDPLLLRLAFGVRRPRTAVRGIDVAATVVAVGANVAEQAQAGAGAAAGAGGSDGAGDVGEAVGGSVGGSRLPDMDDSRGEGASARALRVGDEVMGELPGGGGLAEYAVAPASRFVLRPAALDPVVASALPLAGGTAWQALELAGIRDAAGFADAARIAGAAGVAAGAGVSDGAGSARRRVLVLGASGGVGHFAVQLAARRGAEVWATCGARTRGLIGELGAARTFDYRTTDAADLPPSSFDAIVDIAGNAPLRALKGLLRPGGTLVMVGGDGGAWLGPVARILRSVFVGLGGQGRRIRPLAAVAKPDVTRRLAALAVAGGIRPVIERRYALAEAGAALAHIDSSRTIGKIVVEVAS
jgi:NADPH:quinone reductase-like Zn-dependent oxidoreductase